MPDDRLRRLDSGNFAGSKLYTDTLCLFWHAAAYIAFIIAIRQAILCFGKQKIQEID